MFNDTDNLRICKTCGQYETNATSGICWCCREQEMIDDADIEPSDWSVWDEYDQDEEDWIEAQPGCGCPFCHCSNFTIMGETCDECLAGAHQG